MALDCNERTCIHNMESKCFAKTINIKGSRAKKTSDTYCGSYIYCGSQVPRYDVEFAVELVDNDPPTDVSSISCDAAGCKFNTNKRCKASKVVINIEDSSCNSFLP